MLIWITKTHNGETYYAAKGAKGLYELVARPTADDQIVDTFLDGKPISTGHIGFGDAVDFAQDHDDGFFDEDHYDNGGRFACERLPYDQEDYLRSDRADREEG